MLSTSDIKKLRKCTASRNMSDVQLIQLYEKCLESFNDFLDETDDDFFEDDAYDFILEKVAPYDETCDMAEMLDVMMPIILKE